MRDLLYSIRDVWEGSIGTCPRCMRAAFLAAACFAVTATVATLFLSSIVATVAWFAAAALTALWLAHAWKLSQRSARAAEQDDAKGGKEATPLLPRRQALDLFVRALAFSALAGLAPGVASAQAKCPCASPLKCCWNYDRTSYVCAPSSANCCAHATSPWYCSSPKPNCNGDGSDTANRCR